MSYCVFNLTLRIRGADNFSASLAGHPCSHTQSRHSSSSSVSPNKSLAKTTMAMGGRLLLLALAVATLVAVSVAEHEVLASGSEGHGDYDNVYRASNNKGQGAGQGNLKIYQCSGQCARRCGKTQYGHMCFKMCNKCCAKCLCVPSGYYGNKAECACYNNWKTKEGGPKCP